MNSVLLKGYLSFFMFVSVAGFATEGGEVATSVSTEEHKEVSDDSKGEASEGVELVEKLMRIAKSGKGVKCKENEACQKAMLDLFNKIIRESIINNKDLRQNRCDVLKGLGSNAKARGDFLPNVNLVAGAEHGYSDKDKEEYSLPQKKYDDKGQGRGIKQKVDGGLEVGYNLFNGGGSIAGLKIASNDNKAKFYSYKAAEGVVLFKIFQAAVGVITNKILLKQNEENVIMHKELVTAAIEKMKVGEVDRTEVAHAESKYAKSLVFLEENKTKLAASISDFELMTGMTGVQFDTCFPDFSKFLPVSLEEMKNIANKENSKILAAHYATICSKANVKKAKSGYAPNLNLSFNAKYGTVVDKNKQKTPSSTWTEYDSARQKGTGGDLGVGVSFKMPLDFNRSITTDVQGASHEYVKTQVAEAKTQSEVMSDIETLFGKLKNDIKIIEFYQRHVQACEVILQGNMQEMAVGAKVHVQVIKAQADLAEARGYLVQAQKEKIITELNLLLSIGRLGSQSFGANGFNFDPSRPEGRNPEVKPQQIQCVVAAKEVKTDKGIVAEIKSVKGMKPIIDKPRDTVRKPRAAVATVQVNS